MKTEDKGLRIKYLEEVAQLWDILAEHPDWNKRDAINRVPSLAQIKNYVSLCPACEYSQKVGEVLCQNCAIEEWRDAKGCFIVGPFSDWRNLRTEIRTGKSEESLSTARKISKAARAVADLARKNIERLEEEGMSKTKKLEKMADFLRRNPCLKSLENFKEVSTKEGVDGSREHPLIKFGNSLSMSKPFRIVSVSIGQKEDTIPTEEEVSEVLTEQGKYEENDSYLVRTMAMDGYHVTALVRSGRSKEVNAKRAAEALWMLSREASCGFSPVATVVFTD
jgi:hypothetical protein